MTTRTHPAPTRVEPLAVHVHEHPDRITVTVGGHEVAHARPDGKRAGAWTFQDDSRIKPCRVPNRETAAALIGDVATVWSRHEKALWHPDHGQPDEYGYMPSAPNGAVCVTCGKDLGGSQWASLARDDYRGETTITYVCGKCDVWVGGRHG